MTATYLTYAEDFDEFTPWVLDQTPGDFTIMYAYGNHDVLDENFVYDDSGIWTSNDYSRRRFNDEELCKYLNDKFEKLYIDGRSPCIVFSI